HRLRARASAADPQSRPLHWPRTLTSSSTPAAYQAVRLPAVGGSPISLLPTLTSTIHPASRPERHLLHEASNTMDTQETPTTAATVAAAGPPLPANDQALELTTLKGKTMSELLGICQELEI